MEKRRNCKSGQQQSAIFSDSSGQENIPAKKSKSAAEISGWCNEECEGRQSEMATELGLLQSQLEERVNVNTGNRFDLQYENEKLREEDDCLRKETDKLRENLTDNISGSSNIQSGKSC